MIFVEIYWPIKPLNFSPHQNFDIPKIPKHAINFDYTRQAKSSLTATTGFRLPPKSQSKGFCCWGVLVLITVFAVPCNWLVIVHWLVIVQKSQELFFNMESTRFSKPGFPITTNLMSLLKSQSNASYLKLKTWLRRSLNLYPSVESWWTRVARNCF